MTRPARVLMWMLPFLALIGLAVVVLFDPLSEAFFSNPVFNGIIIVVFLAGIIVNFQQVYSLSSEAAWVDRQRSTRPRRGAARRTRMLLALENIAQQHGDQPMRLSPLSLRAVLDSVRLRLDEARDVSRYTIGLLIFLGLLGTFWGLLQTVSAVGQMIAEVSTGGGENGVLFGSLLAGLEQPLAGMGTAFSSSLFGLAGSLILGFLDLQVGHAQNRFFNQLEEWLTGLTRLSGLQQAAEGGLSEPTYIHALLEKTADTLDKLQRGMVRDEAQRRDLDASILRLAEELSSGRDQLSDEIRDELRLIARALAAEARARRKPDEHARAG
ncbi:MAG: flagellar motor protein MotA [Thiogranum sp.]|nr:flagellar motor protein MotA [Thiogranum sp.]